MPHLSQLDQMRALIREELVPRVVNHVSSPTTMGGRQHVFEYWFCTLCEVKTPIHNNNNEPINAQHTTYCKIREALGVVE